MTLGVAQEPYRKAPPAVQAVLDAPSPPATFLSPALDVLILAETRRYPPIAELAQPVLKLAGVRIDPATNGRQDLYHFTGYTLLRIADGARTRMELPAGLRLGEPVWSPDGRRFVFTHTGEDGIQLWMAETATGKARPLEGIRLNPVLGDAMQWTPDGKALVVKRVPPGRAPAPVVPKTPEGPNVQESSGKEGISSTYEVRDTLKSRHDEMLFDYYATSELCWVSVETAQEVPIGAPALHGNVSVAPGGRYLLVERIVRPYSYLHTWNRFPSEVEIWTLSGERVRTVAQLPLADRVPIRGVPTGPRGLRWRPTEPATLTWIEALDGGDPKARVSHRDRLVEHVAPFTQPPREILKTEHRMSQLHWLAKDPVVLVSEVDIDRQWGRTWALDTGNPFAAPRLVWDRSLEDRYGHPGAPALAPLPSGAWGVLQDGDFIYLAGSGASPKGIRPFLDRFNLKTLKAERLFRSDLEGFETFVAWLDPAAGTFLTRRETPAQPPNYHIRSLSAKVEPAEPGEPVRRSQARALTDFSDPTPQIRGIRKQVVTYEREDGVKLSFTLYLPPGYKEGRLPTVMAVYPSESTDPQWASQVARTDRQFTTIGGASHLFFLLEGYAVIDHPTLPVVGDPQTVYDTFLEQVVSGARAAVKKAVEMGVADPERIGVMGHSHGGRTTALLLAHSDLFRAGIARSGAYNQTLSAFGFQGERRSLWEAREHYFRMSALMAADQIKEPILIVHGEDDPNPGTIPMQSQRLYEAVRAHGGTVRLVMLPLEGHGYAARESVEHTLHEMLAWFDTHVKKAPSRNGGQAQGK